MVLKRRESNNTNLLKNIHTRLTIETYFLQINSHNEWVEVIMKFNPQFLSFRELILATNKCFSINFC